MSVRLMVMKIVMIVFMKSMKMVRLVVGFFGVRLCWLVFVLRIDVMMLL